MELDMNWDMRNLALLLLLAILSSCQKSKTSANANTDSQYYYSGGQCYSRNGNQVVDPSLCGQTGQQSNINFRLQGSNCLNLVNNQFVHATYCSSNPFVMEIQGCRDTLANEYVSSVYCGRSEQGQSTGQNRYFWYNQVCYDSISNQTVDPSLCQQSNSGSCVGTYYFYVNGQKTPVECNGSDCSGNTLYNQSDQQVYCQ